jgi:predicted alpha/beta-fold hydrolase
LTLIGRPSAASLVGKPTVRAYSRSSLSLRFVQHAGTTMLEHPSTAPLADPRGPANGSPPLPHFRPHPLLATGHLQTLGGLFLPGPLEPYRARQHRVALADGDQIVLHDDCPAEWRPGDRTVLLLHGLAGCHASPHLQRVAAKLNQRGIRTFRMDLRGCGAGVRLARLPYHSGRSDDAGAAVEEIGRLCPGSPTTLLGFSLGGNIALKLLGEAAQRLPQNLDSGIAVGPPIDLVSCVEALRTPLGRIYDRYFTRMLLRRIAERKRLLPDAVTAEFHRPPRSLREFDELFTAPICGFGTAENYYRQCSAAQFLPRIRVPTWILAAHDDPMVPSGPLESAARSPSIRLHMTDRGGHIGYLARPGIDPDRYWMDWRIVEWVLSLS